MVWKETKKYVAQGLILGVVGGGFFMVYDPARNAVTGAWENLTSIDDRFKGVHDRLDTMSADIEDLKRPSEVFRISEVWTRPERGVCFEGSACKIKTRIRRVVAALDCQFLSGSVRLGFIDTRSGVPIYARRVDPARSGSNIGVEWFPVEVVLETPVGLSPSAEFFIEAAYTECPGTSEQDDPIVFRSNAVPLKVSMAP